MAEEEKKNKKKDNNTEIEKKKERENRIKSETQGSVWISQRPNKPDYPTNAGEDVNYDKMKGIEEESEEEKKKKKKD